MLSSIRTRLSYANVMATIAVFVALGGGAVAAGVKLKANSVKTKNIKDAAITTPKLGEAAVTAAKLGNVTIRTTTTTGLGVDGGVVLDSACQSGEKLTGGGAEVTGEATVIDNGVRVNESYPVGNAWRARATDSAGTHQLKVYAVCVTN